MKRKLSLAMTVLLVLCTLLTGCGGDEASGADLLPEENGGAQDEGQENQGNGGSPESYHIKFSKYYKIPTIDFHKQEVALLTGLFSGIDAEITPGQEFTYSASASAEGWSATLEMTGVLGETNYRDGVIPALKGTMEFAATHSDGQSKYEFSGPFVLPFATLRPMDPDHETLKIGYQDVVGERSAKIKYYLGGELDGENPPPEDFRFTVEPVGSD